MNAIFIFQYYFIKEGPSNKLVYEINFILTINLLKILIFAQLGKLQQTLLFDILYIYFRSYRNLHDAV
jgi:hypothetical protein